LASNADETFPTEAHELAVPGTGTMVTAIKTPSGREPQVFGKPFTAMFEAISETAERPIVPSRTLMIGDRCVLLTYCIEKIYNIRPFFCRCNTDIMFGKSCKLKTLLVLTGVTTLEHLQSYIEEPDKQDLVPDFYTDSVDDILLLQNL